MDFDDIILWYSTERIRQASRMDFANVTLKDSFSANSGMEFDNVTLQDYLLLNTRSQRAEL